jgi:hypothetical protein
LTDSTGHGLQKRCEQIIAEEEKCFVDLANPNARPFDGE